MSFKPAVDALSAKLAAGFSSAPILKPNDNQDPPDASPWVLFEVQGGENNIHTAGTPTNRLFLHDGTAWAHVMVPQGTGETVARGYADTIAALFNQTDIPAPSVPQIVRTQAASIGAGESADEKGKWWRVSVSVPFQFFFFA